MIQTQQQPATSQATGPTQKAKAIADRASAYQHQQAELGRRVDSITAVLHITAQMEREAAGSPPESDPVRAAKLIAAEAEAYQLKMKAQGKTVSIADAVVHVTSKK